MTAKDALAVVFDEFGIEDAPQLPMTAQEAFAIAFDALPSINDPNAKLPNSKPAKGNIKKNPAAAATALGKGIGIGGGMSPKGEKTLAEHAEECQAKSPETCPYTRKLAKQIASQNGMSMEEAMGEATKMHAAATQQVMQGGGQPTAGAGGMMQPQQMPVPEAQPLDPKAAEQQVEQLEANPAAIPDAQGELLPQPEMIETVAGSVPVQTTVQKAGVETINERAADGDEEAIATLGTIKEGLTSGESEAATPESEVAEEPSISNEELTSDPRYQKLVENYDKVSEGEKIKIINGIQQLKETIKNEKRGKASSLGSETPKEQEEAVDPRFEKLAEEYAEAETDEERDEIIEKAKKLRETVKKEKSAEESTASSESHTEGGGDGDNGGTPPPPPSGGGETPSDTPPPPPPPPETPKEPPKEKSTPSGEAPTTPPPPSDDEFRVDERTYEVGDTTYRDVSKMGLLHGMLSSFMAGLRGEDIITGWDRISGNWDKIKRSAAGEQLRGGIAGASFLGELDKMAAKSLSPEAKTSLEAVRKMFEDATTPQKQMAAIKQYRQWKKDYEDEIGTEPPLNAGDFSNLGVKNPEWKAPSTSIFPPVSADERDTSFMEEKEGQILDGLRDAGVGVDVLDRVNGSSVVQFKVQRQVNGTDKALQDALKKLEADLGITISYSPDTSSGALRTGTITINNPKVKDASLRRLLEDKKGVESAKKMAAPLLVGETADGKAVWCDASEHGFLGGDSGSGKSERIIGMLSGAYSVKSPSELQVVINAHANAADFEDFEDDPHTGAIGHNIDEVAENLSKANAEWKRRQKLFADMGIRNLKEYNEKMDAEGTPEKKLPQIMVITDEVTNLLAEKPSLADQIRGIVTNGRKFGVAHIGATQDMKASNMPTDIKGSLRMGVKATKKEAPRAIFDVHTDELGKINSKGDIMYRDKSGNIVRLRGTYADKESRNRLRDYNTGKIKDTPAPEEKTEKPVEEPPKEEKTEKTAEKPEEPKKSKDMRIDFSSRESMLNTAKAIKDKEIAEADERYQKSGDLDKYEEAVRAAEEKENRVREMADRRYPDQALADGDDEKAESLPAPAESEQKPEEEPKEEEWESPLARANKPENRIAAARDDYENGVKALDAEKRKKGMSEKDYYAKLEELEANYNKKIEQIKSGKSIKQILEEEEKTTKAEEAKNEALRKSVVTSTKKGPVAGAVHMLQGGRGKIQNLKPMPSMQAAAAKKNLPDGFEIDSDDRGRPLVNGMGLSYARNPKNGSYGWIDRNGGFHMKVNTADSRYKGENSQEAQDLKAKIGRSHGARKAQFEKQYRGVAFGLDEAPDGMNMEIVAAAVQDAIAEMDDVPTVG